MMTYISLFSGAGVGCHGFRMEGFECVATNELIPRRLDVQRFNRTCKYESGYLCGDLTKEETRERLFGQIDLWKEKEALSRVDVVVATPPCQGMSVANHKKTATEIVRNSLVVESIKIIQAVHPRFFVFENVPAFMKTICTDVDGTDKPIAEAIRKNLGASYSYISRVINFKQHGACSSRLRTLVIGVANDYANEVSPLELYPPHVPEKTLREVIGDLKPLEEFGEIDPEDIYHSFRVYPEHMRKWIADLKEGQSAFDQAEDEKKPHKVVDGEIVINQRKNGDKYRRQYWDKVGPCIHTRNDQLASQNTVHPSDDRVFSIRELMRMMTVPEDFQWTSQDFDTLNGLSLPQKRAFLKNEEIKIRQSLGEAVPTVIFQEVAKRIRRVLAFKPLSNAQIHRIVDKCHFGSVDELIRFIEENPMGLSVSALGRVAELSNTRRTDMAAYCTSKPLATELLNALPDFAGPVVRILEPSVGVGNFIPLIAQRFSGKEIYIDAVDIDAESLRILKALLKDSALPQNCHIRLVEDDFLTHEFSEKYDYIIGNPPFQKLNGQNKMLKVYRKGAINQDTNNICSFFLDKAVGLGNYVALVFPKFLLNTPEFAASREYLAKKPVEGIIDFGEKGFPGVLVETIAILINHQGRISKTRVKSVTRGIELLQNQRYIFDQKYPYWLIYRNEAFDEVSRKLRFDAFTVFRDRQLTNKNLNPRQGVWVVKSRNISDDGRTIDHIEGYDSYVEPEIVPELSVSAFLEREDVYLTPNMTYKPRVVRKPKGVLVNGSVAILIPKNGEKLTDAQLAYYASREYREFYQIARNYQTRSLNVDACSVFFYGVLREDEARAAEAVGANRSVDATGTQAGGTAWVQSVDAAGAGTQAAEAAENRTEGIVEEQNGGKDGM